MSFQFYSMIGRLTALACLAIPALGCVPAALPVALGPSRDCVRLVATRQLMGVPWTITLHAEQEVAGKSALAAAFNEVARLEEILSDYKPHSELSQLSTRVQLPATLPVSDDLCRVLTRAVEIRDATGGAFDPTVGPLTTLWRQSRRSGQLPRSDKLLAARAAVGRDALLLDSVKKEVTLTRAGMRLDLGGIGMGYAIDRAMDVLAGHGIKAAMIDASGDIAVSHAPPGSTGWRIAMAPLGKTQDQPVAQHLLLTNAAVTTSGDAFQSVEIDGTRYSHIVDPRTGIGVVGQTAVTVIAPDCTTADALATAASVLGPSAGLAAVAATPGCAARFVWKEGGEVRSAQSPRWPVH